MMFWSIPSFPRLALTLSKWGRRLERISNAPIVYHAFLMTITLLGCYVACLHCVASFMPTPATASRGFEFIVFGTAMTWMHTNPVHLPQKTHWAVLHGATDALVLGYLAWVCAYQDWFSCAAVVALMFLIMLFCIQRIDVQLYVGPAAKKWEYRIAAFAVLLCLAAMLLGMYHPWVLALLTVLIYAMARCTTWCFLHKGYAPLLAQNQHRLVWPLLARVCPGPHQYWNSFSLYACKYEPPVQYLHEMVRSLDIDFLLTYFENPFMHRETFKGNRQKEIAASVRGTISTMVVARVGELDERAKYIFEIYANDLCAGAKALRDVRAGTMMQRESLALPDMGAIQ